MDTEAFRSPHDKPLQCVLPLLSSHKTREFVDARDVDYDPLEKRVRSPLTSHDTRLHRDLARNLRKEVGEVTIYGGCSK
jgi:hypothetical protein